MNQYTGLIETFYFNPVPAPTKKVLDANEAYLEAVARKESADGQWDHLIDILRKRYPDNPVRDGNYFCAQHSMKLQFVFELERKAVVLLLSYAGNLLGFHYVDHDIPMPDNPVYGNNGKIIPYISYYPFSPAFEQYRDLLTAVTEETYGKNAFKPFDPAYAGMKVENVRLNGILTEEIDLFQLFFCSNLHGIV